MTMMTFIRHGETDANRENIVQGQFDSPLNDRGRQQCALLGARIAAWPKPPTAFYASPLRRAAESAAIIAEKVAEKVAAEAGGDGPRGEVMAPQLLDGLMEMSFGALDGQSRAAIEASHGADFLKGIFNDRTSAEVVAGGESPRQVLARFTATVAELRRTHPEPGSHIAVVTHGLALRNYCHHLLDIPVGAPKFRFRNTAITQVTFLGESCYFAAIGDAAHLEHAAHKE